METELKKMLDSIEKFYGSAGAAAAAAGVTATSWSRWKSTDKDKRIIPSGPRLKLIELLYEQAINTQKAV